MVAVILGTGTNACYVEQISAIPKLKVHASSTGKMVSSKSSLVSFLFLHILFEFYR